MVSNQQFRLKWNNHRNTVLQEFETLLHNNSFVDCTIGADGKYLKAHKIVLSACSPYLQNVFNEHFDKHPVILLKDVSFKELKCMIDYMYCGEVNISECELPSFLRTAQSLKIKGLAEDINDYDSASDNEPTEVNSFAENNRSVEANVEIHDDEPLTKKSAPSLISANIVNNSVTGRKRKIPNPVPICGKVSANSHNQTKNAGTATPNSSKSTDTSVSVPTSVAENESTERTTMNENSIIKNENTDTSNKKTTIQSESQDQKSRTEVKEEPVDTDADNEDNSSFECGNNDSDLLNEDSESGNKFGELSIASVSSFNENDANGYLMSQFQQFQFQQSGEVNMFHQNPPANKTFSKSSLYAIKNGCYGPFYCPRCNNHYMWKKNLMRHMKLECGKEPSFQCPICPLRTKHKSSLLGHIRNKHFINLNA